MKTLALLFAILIIAFYSTNAQEKRIALVIGNATYTMAALKNPVNDANLMATTLQELGFTVIKKTNANRMEMAQAIADFWSKLDTYNVALFYYAGHGVQVNGVNYLIPVDAKLASPDMVSFEAISVNDVAAKFANFSKNTNILILDACRNDPFRSWTRGGERGFKAMNPGSGTIIAFATGEGGTSSDGTGANGLFTENLVQQLKKPQPIETVFKNTRVAVQKASGGNQSPQEWTQLTGEFYFVKGTNIEGNQQQTQEVYTPETKTLTNDMVISEEVLTGTIRITSAVDGEFYFDGTLKGNFTKGRIYTLNNIEVGNHTMKVGEWSETLNLESGKIYEIIAKETKHDLLDIYTCPVSGIKMKYVKGGSFFMGSTENESGRGKDETQHEITISDFWIGIYEVTQEQWKAVMGTSPSNFKGEDLPVEMVSWNDVQQFIRKLNLLTSKNFRLPSEAQWEYAARGGVLANKAFSLYSGSSSIAEVGWYDDNSDDKSHPVGLKQPNELGLFDMCGNVYEWCNDWYLINYYDISDFKDPQGSASGTNRVLRGGSWKGIASFCRIANRGDSRPEVRQNNYGFRLILVP